MYMAFKTLSSHRVLNKENSCIWKNHAEDVHQKLIPDRF